MKNLLDKSNPVPLHIQLESIIIQKIQDEEWPADSNIPSENELCKIYGISRMTVHSALNRIAEAGLIYRVPGKGTFVSPPKIVGVPPTQTGIREQLEMQGFETSTKLINIETSIPKNRIRKVLNINQTDLIYIIKRVRYVKGEPLSIHISYMPAKLFHNMEKNDLIKNQMCDIVEKQYNYVIEHYSETLETITATGEEAGYLDIKAGFPLLLLENTAFTTGGKPIEFTKIIFRGDKIKIQLEFNKK